MPSERRLLQACSQLWIELPVTGSETADMSRVQAAVLSQVCAPDDNVVIDEKQQLARSPSRAMISSRCHTYVRERHVMRTMRFRHRLGAGLR
jgi:hypothetical protein